MRKSNTLQTKLMVYSIFYLLLYLKINIFSNNIFLFKILYILVCMIQRLTYHLSPYRLLHSCVDLDKRDCSTCFGTRVLNNYGIWSHICVCRWCEVKDCH